MKYLISFSYDGTLFHGFQRQKDVKNVQGTLESVLSNYFNKTILIKGSGRTDAGVHAICQCAHFECDRVIKNKDIKNINKLLNKEIVIKKFRLVDNNFHARYNVYEKTYVYKINNGKYKTKYEGYYYQIKKNIDIKKMREASKVLIGENDYHNFVSGSKDNTKTIIYSIKIYKIGSKIIFVFKGAGFYRYMVRHLVGALLDVGLNKLNKEELKRMLDNNYFKESRVVPASGLYLMNVKFDK